MESALERAPGVDAADAPTWRQLWTPARARLWLMACAVAAFLPAVGVPIRGWLDFSAFYTAGALAFSSDVARLAPVVAWQQLHGLPITPFVYPPGMALLYVPFAALPYGLAAALHLALMAGLLVTAAILGADALGLPRRWSVIAALAWGPAAAGILSGQNTALALLLVVVAALALQRDHEGRSGGLIGLLAYKPQLAAPLVLLLVLRSRWTALLGVALVVGAQYLAGIVATGGNVAWPADWVATLNAYTGADFAANGWQAISLPALGQHLQLVTGIPGSDPARLRAGCRHRHRLHPGHAATAGARGGRARLRLRPGHQPARLGVRRDAAAAGAGRLRAAGSRAGLAVAVTLVAGDRLRARSDLAPWRAHRGDRVAAGGGGGALRAAGPGALPGTEPA